MNCCPSNQQFCCRLDLESCILQSRVEEEADKDAMQKSDAAQEAFLAELAKDRKSPGSKDIESSKQTRDKTKEKKKVKDHKKLKDLKVCKLCCRFYFGMFCTVFWSTGMVAVVSIVEEFFRGFLNCYFKKSQPLI